MQKYLQSTIIAKKLFIQQSQFFRKLHKQILLHLIPINGFVQQNVPIFIQLYLYKRFCRTHT